MMDKTLSYGNEGLEFATSCFPVICHHSVMRFPVAQIMSKPYICYNACMLCVQLHVAEGLGKPLVTPPHSEFVFGRVSARDMVHVIFVV